MFCIACSNSIIVECEFSVKLKYVMNISSVGLRHDPYNTCIYIYIYIYIYLVQKVTGRQ